MDQKEKDYWRLIELESKRSLCLRALSQLSPGDAIRMRDRLHEIKKELKEIMQRRLDRQKGA